MIDLTKIEFTPAGWEKLTAHERRMIWEEWGREFRENCYISPVLSLPEVFGYHRNDSGWFFRGLQV